MNSIDESVNPCDDFYRACIILSNLNFELLNVSIKITYKLYLFHCQFSCGGWIENTEIPFETGGIDVNEQSRERLNIQLKG